MVTKPSNAELSKPDAYAVPRDAGEEIPGTVELTSSRWLDGADIRRLGELLVVGIAMCISYIGLAFAFGVGIGAAVGGGVIAFRALAG